MALHFTLKMNGAPIGYFYARRREQLTDKDAEYTYDIAISHNGTDQRFAVKHRYNDGAFALVQRSLEKVVDVAPLA
jgi:hypothetical protein